jgi:LEA14-like dessication related protein
MKKSLLCLLVLLLLAGCAANKGTIRGLFRQPEVAVDRISLAGFDLEKASVILDLAVLNPNPVSVRLREIGYRLSVNSSDREIVSATNRTPVEIAAGGTSLVPFPLVLRYAEITNLDWTATNLPYVFEGTAVADTLVGPVSLPFRKEGAVPIPRLPVVRLEKLEALNFSPLQLKAAFEVTVSLSNRNPFPLAVKNLDYSLSLDANVLSKGRTSDQSIALSPKSTGRVFILVDVDLSRLRDVASAVIRGTAVKFGFSGSYNMDGAAVPSKEFGYSDQGEMTVKK